MLERGRQSFGELARKRNIECGREDERAGVIGRVRRVKGFLSSELMTEMETCWSNSPGGG